MLSKFLSLFKPSKKEKFLNSTNQSANLMHNQVVQYNPHLVDSLLDDHKELLALIVKIQKSVKNNKWVIANKQLLLFKEKLYNHLLIENSHLYTYLQRSLKDDPANLDLMKELQKEMKGISLIAISFFKKYNDLDTDIEKQSEFDKDFESVCTVLGKRIDCEENKLYSLYHP